MDSNVTGSFGELVTIVFGLLVILGLADWAFGLLKGASGL